MVVACPQLAERRNDGLVAVRDHPRLDQVDADARQFPREKVHVGVAGAARQDFVADDQDGGGRIGHDGPVLAGHYPIGRGPRAEKPRLWPTAEFVTI